jgi:hypothetical protein
LGYSEFLPANPVSELLTRRKDSEGAWNPPDTIPVLCAKGIPGFARKWLAVWYQERLRSIPQGQEF